MTSNNWGSINRNIKSGTEECYYYINLWSVKFFIYCYNKKWEIWTWLPLHYKALGMKCQFSNTTKKEEVKLWFLFSINKRSRDKEGTLMVLLEPT